MNDIQKSLIDIANFTPGSMESPDAWIGHLPFAYWLVNYLKPIILVELGTHSGNSYFSFCQSVSENNLSAKCYAIDTWNGEEHSGFYGEEVFQKVNLYNQERFSNFSSLLRMKFDDAVEYFSDGSIDFLHIDGLHTYEAVKHDFETWLPKLSPGAVVLFHDINVRERGFGVWKLWEELQTRYPNKLEFVNSHGLGVLQISDDSVKNKIEWLSPSSQNQKILKDYFSELGSRQMERFELHQLKDYAHKINLELTALKQSVSERDDRIVNLTKAVAESDGRIAVYNKTVAKQSEEIDSLNKILTEHKGQISALSKEIFAIRQSTTWKITAPLRWTFHRLKRPNKFVIAATNAIKSSGGFFSALIKVWRIFRNEGVKGLKRGYTVVQMKEVIGPKRDSECFYRNDYQEWVRRYDTLTDEKRIKMYKKIKEFTYRPLISVLMPTYNPNPEWLKEAIESVRKQIYPHWELCIADDASNKKSIQEILKRYAEIDSRIKITFRKKNGHISAASNSALEIVTGEFLALIDHDDLLSEHALFWVVYAINRHPDVKLIYSDEDKIDSNGKRFDPYFKTQWNQDLFYSHNMISHLGVYHTDLLNQIGGFRVGFEGSQDYDLALRCIEQISQEQIFHIDHVLYHWRVHSKSTALTAEAKPYAMRAGERAINEHFCRSKKEANAELIGFGYRVHYSLPNPYPFVSIIIPTKNSSGLLKKCINSILSKTSYPAYEIIIVDNGSDQKSALNYFKKLSENPNIRILHDNRPFNYSALNNAAVKKAKGEIICLLNNDVEVITPDWLNEMVGIALQPGVGVVGAKLWYPNNTLQHGGLILGILGIAGNAHKHIPKGHHGYFGRADLIQSISAVTAACLVTKKKIYEEVGGLNEINLSVAYNDVDFCLRLREKGYRNIWTPYAELYHNESATRGSEDSAANKTRFYNEINYMKQTWGDLLLNDPYYNPNLTLEFDDFSLAWPPRVENL